MDENRGPGAFAAVLWRVSFGILLFGLMLIPAFFAEHFLGLWGGVAVAAVGAVFYAHFVWRHLHENELTFSEFMLEGRPDAGAAHPIVLVLFGLVFFVAGIAVCVSTPTADPEEENQMNSTDQVIFGSIFMMLGGGVSGMGMSCLLARQRRNRILAEFAERIEMRSDSPFPLIERGKYYLDEYEAEAAVKDLSQAIELDADNAEALFHRGRAYYHMDENEKSIADLTRAIELDPKNSEAYILRALAYEDADEPDLADADFTKAEELDEEAGIA